ncbi:hypothetical protein [Micromonospora sp. NPDC050495]|uniref:hypothetical protein n=1 Tax=Micromonospora sp. NPDC050495 TaxID=3154936 RepID=UPI0034060630
MTFPVDPARRLVRGAPARSPLRRAIPNLAPTAYWPLEDGPGAPSGASAVDGVAAMAPYGYSRFEIPGSGGRPEPAAGLPEFATGSGIPGSLPVPDWSRGGVLVGQPPRPTSGTQSWRVAFVAVFPRDMQASGTTFIGWTVSEGTYPYWEIQADSGGLFVTAQDSLGTAGYGTATDPVNLFDGRPHFVEVNALTVLGALAARVYIDGFEYGIVHTIAAPNLVFPPGWVTSITPNVKEWTSADVGSIEGMPQLGHIAVWQPSVPIVGHVEAMRGHAGEPATTRLARLCAEDGVRLSMPNVPDDASSRMGPQPAGAGLDLYRQCAEADLGALYEQGFGLAYVPRYARYNRPTTLTLDYAAGQVAPPLEPVDDDQLLRNRVTVSRPDGSEATVEDAASVTAAGTYERSVEVNLASDEILQSHATWRLHLADVTQWPPEQQLRWLAGEVSQWSPEELRWVAWHEAAHAVVAVVLGCLVDWADLDAGPGYGGTLVAARDPHTDAVVSLAGWMASGGHLWGPLTTHDTQQAIELVGMDAIPAAMRDAEAILVSRRSDVAAVAAALVQHRILTGEQITAMVQGATVPALSPGQPRPGGPPKPTGPSGPRPKGTH